MHYCCQRFFAIIFFGDSLTDTSNGGGATNETTWAAYLDNDYGRELKPSNDGGTNYAVGGAKTQGMYSQINQLIEKDNTLDTKALYVLYGGGNNILGTLNDGTTPDVQTLSTDLSSQAKELHNYGARYIMVINLPDVTLAPLFKNYDQRKVEEIRNSVINANTLIQEKINALPFDVIQIDNYSLSKEIEENPTRFGIYNITGEGKGKKNVDQYFFWDSVHPTSTIHKTLADFVHDTLIAPSQIAMLAETPFANIQIQNNVILNQLDLSTRNHIKSFLTKDGDWKLFFVGGAANSQYEIKNNTTLSNVNIGAGAYKVIDMNKLIGVAYQFSRVNNEFDEDLGGFNYYNNSLSGFGSLKFHNFNFNGIVSLGLLDYYHIERKTKLYKTFDVDHGQTSGSLYSTMFSVDYGLIQKTHFSIKPTVELNYHNVHVNGFNESSANDSATQLNFEDQNNQALNGEIGLKAMLMSRQFHYFQLISQVNVSYRQVWLDENRDIHFSTSTLSGSHSVLTENTNPGNGVITSLNFSGIIENSSVITFGLNDQYDFNHPNLSLSYAISF